VTAVAKKHKKNDAQQAKQPSEGKPVDDRADDEDEATEASGALVTSVLPAQASPLAREQERDLEVGLALSGLLIGALTGLGQVPLGAHEGNIPAAVLGALLGSMLGLNIGRSLFFEVYQQWVVWAGMVLLGLIGFTLGSAAAGLLPGLVGAIVGVGAVTVGMFTVHKRRMVARGHGST
jgi:hypothetical protein